MTMGTQTKRGWMLTARMDAPAWNAKRDPVQHPVRFLAGIWEKRTGTLLTRKGFGQLRDLRKALGDFTEDVIRWSLDETHWSRFGTHVQAASGPGAGSAPPAPHVGYLLKHRSRALDFVRAQLEGSTDPAHASFCTRLDVSRLADWKPLLRAYASGRPAWLAEISAVESVRDAERLFVRLLDDDVEGAVAALQDPDAVALSQMEEHVRAMIMRSVAATSGDPAGLTG